MYLLICFFCVFILGMLVAIACSRKHQQHKKENHAPKEMLVSHLDVVEALERAFKQKNFRILYQPIYGVKEKRIVACEALLRIQDPEHGWLTPSTFIPTAESSGKIFEIGCMVMEEVCSFLSKNHVKELGLDYVNVNLSVTECKDDRLTDYLIEIIDRYQIERSKIRLEIKEADLEEDHDMIRSNLERLNDLGVGLALDGYGTGHSTFSHIISFPFCSVKFDKTMLWSAMASTKALYALCASINMLKDLDMHIVVEGAESEEMVEQLIELRCDYLQGFYFARPMKEEDFVEFMSNN